jgi:hypothetical protein
MKKGSTVQKFEKHYQNLSSKLVPLLVSSWMYNENTNLQIVRNKFPFWLSRIFCSKNQKQKCVCRKECIIAADNNIK